MVRLQGVLQTIPRVHLGLSENRVPVPPNPMVYMDTCIGDLACFLLLQWPLYKFQPVLSQTTIPRPQLSVLEYIRHISIFFTHPMISLRHGASWYHESPSVPQKKLGPGFSQVPRHSSLQGLRAGARFRFLGYHKMDQNGWLIFMENHGKILM